MMQFKKRKREPQISRTEALDCKPFKSTEVTETRLETGEVLLVYSIRVRPWFAGLVKRFGGPDGQTYTKKIQLDLLGTATWDLIDDNRSVRQIIKKFARNHQLHPREAEVAVTGFLRDLGKRGLIGLR
ncbi:PqqD family protein [Thermodesulfobacteriota bacterium]